MVYELVLVNQATPMTSLALNSLSTLIYRLGHQIVSGGCWLWTVMGYTLLRSLWTTAINLTLRYLYSYYPLIRRIFYNLLILVSSSLLSTGIKRALRIQFGMEELTIKGQTSLLDFKRCETVHSS